MTRDELEKLFKRILPRIHDYGERDLCWPWRGKSASEKVRIRRVYGYGLPVSFKTQVDKPYAEVMYKGKTFRVCRIVYEYLTPAAAEIKEPWRLTNSCGNTMCCNPEHWIFSVVGQPRPNIKKAKKDQELTPPDPEELLVQDCEDLLDQIFMVGGPSTLEDLLAHIYMVDFDRELIIKTLKKMGKGHLCNE